MYMSIYTPWHTCGGKRTNESGISFLSVGHRSETQVIRLDSKCHYPKASCWPTFSSL